MPQAFLKPLFPLLGRIVRWRNASRMDAFAAGGEDSRRLVETHREAMRCMADETNPRFDAIENRRDELLARDEPLIDGTLDEGAPWDRDVTIASAANVSRTPRHARYLYGLVRAVKPKRVLELGTNLGISGAYIATALKDNGEGGELVTMDRSAYRQRLASELFQRVGLGNVEMVLGDFAETFDKTIESKGGFEFAFVDGNHHLEPTLHYTDSLCKTAQGTITILFDDIRWSEGMIEAWRQISSDPRLAAGLDLNSISLCRMTEGRTDPPVVSQPYRAEFL